MRLESLFSQRLTMPRITVTEAFGNSKTVSEATGFEGVHGLAFSPTPVTIAPNDDKNQSEGSDDE